MLESFLVRIGSATELPYELLAYQRFLEAKEAPQSTNNEAYLFFEPRVRFTLEPDDRVVAIEPLRVEPTPSGAVIRHPPTDVSIPIQGLEAAPIARMLSLLGREHSLLGVQHLSGCTAQQLDEFMRATFGRLVYIPQTIERFEARIPGTELVRFVGSPYEIQRAYWANMGDCRERIRSHLLGASDRDAWLVELRRLHLVSLLGTDGRSFYRPQSPLGHRDARPGAFYDTPTRTVEEGEVTLIIDGPRVSAPMVGGRIYHELLCRSVGDPDGLAQHRTITDDSGLNWGRLCRGMARSDPAPAPWFCPPRPLTAAHFSRLHESFVQSVEAAETRSLARLGHTLADFHWQFVRLHPFRCANQSLSMNIVNSQLAAAGKSGIPHLLLDQLALRLSQAAYRLVFGRAIRHWSVLGLSAVDRWRELGGRRRKLDQFVARLQNLSELPADCSAGGTDPDAARLALVLD